MPPKANPTQQKATSTTTTIPPTTANYNFGDFITLAPTEIIAQDHITSTTTPTPLVNYINGLDFLPFGISNIPNDPCGRRAVAKCDIPAGTTIICEEASLWVVAAEVMQDFCHHCSKPLTSIPNPLQDQVGIYSFCSRECMVAMERISQIESPIATNYPTILESISIDFDLLRLAIRYIILKYLHACDATMISYSTKTSAGGKSTTGTSKTTPYLQSQGHLMQNLEVLKPTIVEIDSLQGHFQFENDKGIMLTTKTVIKTIYPVLTTLEKGKFLSTLYPFDQDYGTNSAKQQFYYQRLEADILTITARINANIHSLQTYPIDVFPMGDNEKNSAIAQLKQQGFLQSFQYGMGLFPIGAMFNHSCQPNCTFLNQGNVLTSRTIAPIQKGEELLMNYVSLNSDLLTRRFHLLHEKGFWCQCRRCNNHLSTEQITLPLNAAVATQRPVQSGGAAQSKAALQAKAAIAAKQKQRGKTAVATTNTTTSTPTSTASTAPLQSKATQDPKAFTKAELYEEQQIQMLYETFIGNSILSGIIDKIEQARVIAPTEALFSNFRDADLNNSVDTKAGHSVNHLTSSNAVVLKKHMLLLSQWYKNNVQVLPGVEIVDYLNTQCDALIGLMGDAGKQFRVDFGKALKQSIAEKQAEKSKNDANAAKTTVDSAVTDETTPEGDEVDDKNNVDEVTVDLTLLKKQSSDKFITKLNDVYGQGLEFPSFKPFNSTNKTTPPMMTDQYYQTIQDNLQFFPTKKNKDGQQPVTSPYRMYIILVVGKLFEQLLSQTLEVVQSGSPFAQKQSKVEEFASYLYATYPVSLYHNQYQIIVLLSNIMTTTCPNVATPAGMTFFISKLMLIYKVMYFISSHTLPTHFMGFVDPCQQILKSVAKAESIITKNIATPTAKNLQKLHSALLTSLKNSAKKRCDAVMVVNYGPNHTQTQAM